PAGRRHRRMHREDRHDGSESAGRMNTTTFHDKPETSPQLKALYQRLSAKNTAPLWEVLGEIVTPQPKAGCVPVLWRYDEVRALLMDAGALISAREAERRGVGLEGSGVRGQAAVKPAPARRGAPVETGRDAPER